MRIRTASSQLCGLHPQQKFNATVRLKVQGLSPGLPPHQVFGRWLGQEPKDSSRSGADHCCCCCCCCCYGGKPIYLAVAERQPDRPVATNIPPRSTAVPSPTASSTPSQRDRHIATIRTRGSWVGRRRSSMAGARSRRPPCSGHKTVIGRGPRPRHRSTSAPCVERTPQRARTGSCARWTRGRAGFTISRFSGEDPWPASCFSTTVQPITRGTGTTTTVGSGTGLPAAANARSRVVHGLSHRGRGQPEYNHNAGLSHA